jgi:hypothetical protein
VAVLVLIILLNVPLLVVGLASLYRRLPTISRPASTISFGVSLSGLLLYNVSYAGLILPIVPGRWAEPATAIGFAGLYAMLLGIAVMGIMALSSKALGRWSFAPLVLAASGAGWVFGYSIMLLLYAVGWILLGISLWNAPQPATEDSRTTRV